MKRLPKIVSFTGKMGSGKTEAARILVAIHREAGGEAVIIKFAQPIYRIVESICQITNIGLDKNKLRPLFQFTGMFFRNTYGEDFWVQLWRKDFWKLDFRVTPVLAICDDCRFDNEAEAIVDQGGVIVNIVSSEENRQSRGLSLAEAEHASEQGVSSEFITLTIHNNGTKEELYTAIKALYEQLSKKE